ncbi:tRNA methyltransferase tyw3 [Tyrophagus putrescentiae]|nr:tRNA methyltransferase tyw3 [Tyrophagus putrescentiae]
MYNYRPAKRGHQQPHQQQHQQPGKQFANEKRQALVQKLDRSRKGELDELVQPLCDLINADARYYTTSSCSGRLTLCGLKKKKRETKKTEEEESFGRRTPCSDTPSYEAVDLKFEPVIFHVRAVDLEAATALLQVALQAGFRNSGIVTSVGRSHRALLLHRRPAPHAADGGAGGGRGVVVTPDEYIHELVNVANGKFAAKRGGHRPSGGGHSRQAVHGSGC